MESLATAKAKLQHVGGISPVCLTWKNSKTLDRFKKILLYTYILNCLLLFFCLFISILLYSFSCDCLFFGHLIQNAGSIRFSDSISLSFKTRLMSVTRFEVMLRKVS